MFDLDPNQPIWIVNAVYDVRGHPPSTAEDAETLSAGNGHLDITSPFGAYTSPTHSERSPMLAQFPHLTMKRKEWGEQDDHYRVGE